MFVDLLYRHRHARRTSADDAAVAAGVEDDDPLDLVRPLSGATGQWRYRCTSRCCVATIRRWSPARSRRWRWRCSASRSWIPTRWRRCCACRSGLRRRLPPPIRKVAAGDQPRRAAAGRKARDGAGQLVGLWQQLSALLAGSATAPTPAMALFDATCRRRGDLAGCALGGASPLDVPARFTAPLTVLGAFTAAPGAVLCEGRLPAHHRRDGGVPRGGRGSGARCSSWRSARCSTCAAREDPELALPCPVVPVIRADALLDGDPARSTRCCATARCWSVPASRASRLAVERRARPGAGRGLARDGARQPAGAGAMDTCGRSARRPPGA